MGVYRISRNIEASLLDYIKDELANASWNNISVIKTFNKAYGIELPSICVRVSDTEHVQAQIGSNATVRQPLVIVDIFGKDDGNRLDLKDFLVFVLRKGLPYYEYIIVNGQVDSKTQNGRIRVLNIDDNIINLNVDKNDLDVHDRYRHELVLTISLGKVED